VRHLKILDRPYKSEPGVDDRAKFHVGRPTHRGDLALKKCCLCFLWQNINNTRNLGQSQTWVRPAP